MCVHVHMHPEARGGPWIFWSLSHLMWGEELNLGLLLSCWFIPNFAFYYLLDKLFLSFQNYLLLCYRLKPGKCMDARWVYNWIHGLHPTILCVYVWYVSVHFYVCRGRNWCWLSSTGLQFFFFFEMGMSWILDWTNLARIAHQRPFCYCPLSVRIMRMCHHVWHVYVGARDGSKLGSSLLRTIPLLIQPSFHQNIFRVVKSCSTKLSLKVSCKFGSKNLLPPTSVDSCPNYSCLMTTPYSSLIEGRNGQLLLEVPCDVVQSLPIFRRFLLYV